MSKACQFVTPTVLMYPDPVDLFTGQDTVKVAAIVKTISASFELRRGRAIRDNEGAPISQFCRRIVRDMETEKKSRDLLTVRHSGLWYTRVMLSLWSCPQNSYNTKHTPLFLPDCE